MATPDQPRPIPAPVVYPDNAHFWKCAEEGKLVLKRCADCAAYHWYPRPSCPFCGSDRTEWLQASGLGTVYSISVTRKGGPTPYAIAYVTLDEGVTLLTNIVDCDLDGVGIGDRVQVAFTATEGGPPVPVFSPARREPASERSLGQ